MKVLNKFRNKSSIAILTIIYVFVFALTAGCGNFQRDEYYHLPTSYRSLLNKGDTLVYVDSHSKTDTFLVFKKISGTYRVSLSGSSCKDDPSAYFDIEFIYLIRNNEVVSNAYCNSFSEDMLFGECESGYNCDQSIFIGVWATDPNLYFVKNSIPLVYWYGEPFGFDSIINSMKVLNIEYDSIFHFSKRELIKTDSTDEIYYSYKFGIIQMKESSGNILKLNRE